MHSVQRESKQIDLIQAENNAIKHNLMLFCVLLAIYLTQEQIGVDQNRRHCTKISMGCTKGVTYQRPSLKSQKNDIATKTSRQYLKKKPHRVGARFTLCALTAYIFWVWCKVQNTRNFQTGIKQNIWLVLSLAYDPVIRFVWKMLSLNLAQISNKKDAVSEGFATRFCESIRFWAVLSIDQVDLVQDCTGRQNPLRHTFFLEDRWAVNFLET